MSAVWFVFMLVVCAGFIYYLHGMRPSYAQGKKALYIVLAIAVISLILAILFEGAAS